MDKLKSFIKTGAENQKGEIIIPPIYNDIERIDKYLGIDENNKISNVSESIYVAYSPPYYDIYTSTGKIDCSFNIKYYCVKNGVLVGLQDSDGYWHVIGIEVSKVKTIYENLSNIESANYGAIVCRQTNDNLFAYSLTTNSYIVPPGYYKEINLYPEGLIVKRKGVNEIYDYKGNTIFSERYDLSVIPGVSINSHELILAQNENNLYGLFSFTGKYILECCNTDISVNKHYCNHSEYISLDVTNINSISTDTHTLFYLDSQLNIHQLISTRYSSIDFFDCGRVALTNIQEDKDCLISMTQISNYQCNKIVEFDKIQPLYSGSCLHFIVWKKNKCGVCDIKGKIIVPIKYKKLEVNEWHNQVYATSRLGVPCWFNL